MVEGLLANTSGGAAATQPGSAAMRSESPSVGKSPSKIAAGSDANNNLTPQDAALEKWLTEQGNFEEERRELDNVIEELDTKLDH